jgi:hypothetical protein
MLHIMDGWQWTKGRIRTFLLWRLRSRCCRRALRLLCYCTIILLEGDRLGRLLSVLGRCDGVLLLRCGFLSIVDGHICMERTEITIK